ncbi:MAG TPA: protein kinase [Terriglobales bacterium]|nr:protein kinase [Terriglobales bacterium]
MTDAWKQWEGHVVDGRFPLRDFQGSTDHSAVFVTSYGAIQEKVALKLLPLPPAGEQPFLTRWERTAKLAHPHLLRLLAWGTCRLSDTQFLYVVTEFAEENLAQILPSRALTAQETEFMLRSTLEVLGYLHGAGLVHAGLKPANLMAVGDDLKLSSDRICLPGDRNLVPRLPAPYDAPELPATGPSPATDIWSLGVTLVEALTQKVSPGAAFREGDPILPEGTPGTFLEIARQCLRLDPERRWTTQDVAARLLPAPLPAKSRSPYAPAMVAVVALGAIFAVGKFLWQRPASKRTTSLAPGAASSSTRPAPVPHDFANDGGAPPVAAPSSEPGRANTSAPASPSKRPAGASVTAPGAVRQKVMPKVSERSLDTITGKIRVSVKLAVNGSGQVTAATLASPGPSHYFAKLAQEASRGWKFTPPTLQGGPVASEWMLRFVFTRGGVEVQPAQSSP